MLTTFLLSYHVLRFLINSVLLVINVKRLIFIDISKSNYFVIKGIFLYHYHNFFIYCRIISIHGRQCSRITKMLLVCGDVILCLTGLLHYKVRRFINLFYFCGEVNLWVRVIQEIQNIDPP